MRISRKILLFCTFIFCITLAGGCEDAPEPVREEVTEGLADQEPEQFVSVKEAAEQVRQLEGKNVSDIVFPKKILMPDTDTVPVLELTPWYTNHDDVYVLEEVLGHIWDNYKNVDWSGAEERKNLWPDLKEYIGINKKDKATGYRCSFNSAGLLYGNSLNGDTPSVSSCIAAYDFEWDNPALSEDDAYELEDGRISVRDAVEYTESLFNDYLSGMEENMFDYKVRHLYVIREDGDYCAFNMVIGKSYKGINLCTVGSYDDQQQEYEVELSGDQFLAVMCHKNSLDFVDAWKGLYNARELDGSREIISPLWAVRLIDQEIAHTGNLHLASCGLVYVLVERSHKPDGSADDRYEGTRYLRPVWLFAEGRTGSSMFNGFSRNFFGASILVDALDGTLYYYGNGTASY